LVCEAWPEYSQRLLVAHDDERLSKLRTSHVLGCPDSEPFDRQILHAGTLVRPTTPHKLFSLQDSLQSGCRGPFGVKGQLNLDGE
jgi:hypothetical protein